MSDQIDISNAITDLEEVFLSSELHTNGTSPPAREQRDKGQAEVSGMENVRGIGAPREHVLFSDRVGSAGPACRLVRAGPPAPGEEADVAGPLPASMQHHARYRVVAAISGFAAAAIALALVVSAPGHGGRSGGPPSAAAPAPGNATDEPSGPGGSSPLASTGGGSAVGGDRTGAASEGRVSAETGVGPRATTGSPREVGPTVVATVPGRGARGAAPGPTPAPPSQNPSPTTPSGGITGVTGALGDTATTVGTTINTTANQLVSTLPATASVGGAANGVGATVTSLGQSLG
jgi:hypothetical protein